MGMMPAGEGVGNCTEVQGAAGPAVSGGLTLAYAVDDQGDLQAVAHGKLFEDGADMELDGALGDAESAGDFLVAGAFGDGARHFLFPRGEQAGPGFCGTGGLVDGDARRGVNQAVHQVFADP